MGGPQNLGCFFGCFVLLAEPDHHSILWWKMWLYGMVLPRGIFWWQMLSESSPSLFLLPPFGLELGINSQFLKLIYSSGYSCKIRSLPLIISINVGSPLVIDVFYVKKKQKMLIICSYIAPMLGTSRPSFSTRGILFGSPPDSIQNFWFQWKCPYDNHAIGILWNLSLPHIAWGLWKEINNKVFKDMESIALVVAIRIRNAIKDNFLNYYPGRKNDPGLLSLARSNGILSSGGRYAGIYRSLFIKLNIPKRMFLGIRPF